MKNIRKYKNYDMNNFLNNMSFLQKIGVFPLGIMLYPQSRFILHQMPRAFRPSASTLGSKGLVGGWWDQFASDQD